MDTHHEIELRHHFDDELDDIRSALVDLGTMVLANVRLGGEVVSENNLAAVDTVIAADAPINETYHKLEEKVFQILALQQPVASDLRFLVAATRILYEMERSGDLAVNIAKQVGRLDGIPSDPVIESVLNRLVDASAAMFARGVEAVATMNPAIGTAAEQEDETTDDCTAELFSTVTAKQNELGLESSVALFYIGRFFERIADHGVNIAQNITFVVTASFPPDD